MSNKVLNIYEFVNSSSLSTRQIAREIFELISKIQEKNITLDFSKIEYISQSFFNEFNDKKNQLKLLNKNIKFRNLEKNFKNVFNIFEENSKLKNNIVYSNISNSKTIII